MTILAILVGLALLLLGRQLFWLFVGGVGFAAGMALVNQSWQGQSEWLALAVGLLVGIIGALLSIFLQRFAIGLAGFLAGGYAVMNWLSRTGREDLAWIAFVIGGIIGALLILFLFDWALIFLSAVTGASLVVDSFKLEPQIALLAFAGLALLGILVQAAQMRRQVPPENRATSEVAPP